MLEYNACLVASARGVLFSKDNETTGKNALKLSRNQDRWSNIEVKTSMAAATIELFSTAETKRQFAAVS